MNRVRNARLAAAVCLAVAGWVAPVAKAVDGTWNVNSSTNWGTAASWVGNTIASGVDGTANFTFNITGNRTITNETARTIGNMTFTDSGTSSHDWTLAGTAANPLTLDVTTGAPTINVTNRTATINAVLAGNDGLARGAGTGVLVLSGANTYSGGTTIGAGTTYVGADSTVTGGVVVSGPLGVGPLTLSGGIFGDNNTTRTLQNALSITASTTFASSGTGSLTFNSAGLTTPAGISITGTTTLTVSNTTTFANAITAAASFTKAGSGTLVLSGDNSAATAITSTAGTLRINSAGAIPAASGRTLTINTSSLAVGYALDNSVLDRVALASSGVIAMTSDTAANLDFSSFTAARLGAFANSTYSGTLTPNAATYRLGGGGATLTVSSALTGAGNTLNVGLGGSSGGTVVLTNASNAFTGVTVGGGALQVNGDGAAGDATSLLGAVPATPTNNLTLSGGGLLRYGGAFTLNVNRSVVLGTGGGGFDTNGQSLTLSNAVSGTGGFIKAGTGALTLGTALPASAPLTVTGGVLDFNNVNYTATTVNMGGAAGPSTLSLGTGTLAIGGTVTFSATNSPAGAVINAGGIQMGGTTRSFAVNDSTNAADDLTINAPITGTGSAGFTKTALAGNLVLAATNTWPGPTQVNGGVLTLSAPTGNAIPTDLTSTPGVGSTNLFINYTASNQIADTASVTLGGVSGNGGSNLQLTTFSDTIAGLSFNNNQSSGATSATTTTGVLTVNGNISIAGTSTGANTIGGNLSLGNGTRTITATAAGQNLLSALVSDGGIVKEGAATLQITNSGNTYTGGTTVNAGILKTGTTATAGAGTGNLGTGNVTVNAVLSGSPATLQLDNSNAIADLATLTVNAGASAALNGKVALNFTGNDTIAGLIIGGVPQSDGLYNATTHPDYFTGGGNLLVVPEPATAGLLAMAGIGLLGRRRRK